MKKHYIIYCTVSFAAALTVSVGSIDAQPAYLDASRPVEERVEDALSRMTLEEKVAMIHAQSKFSSPGVPRLGIPENRMSDGPHGVRAEVAWNSWESAGWTNDAGTAFPCLEALAATWNRDLAFRYGKALGEEALYRGKNVLLGPGVNIVRTPLCGRNHEYMGEDPYLAGQMAVPYIRGVQQNKVSACVKHFALNNQEERRLSYNAEVDERTLHEIYLPAFKAAVQDAGVWAVMGAYNKYLGEHCCHNGYLLCDILKGDWGFDGVVVSDWGGTHDTMQAIRNGLDMEFGTNTDGLSIETDTPYNEYYLADPYLELIKNGTVGTEELDDKVRRVLRLIFRTTMAEDRGFGSFASPEHSALARTVAEEGIVLLKNRNGSLPLNPDKAGKILVVGGNAILKTSWGGGSAELKPEHEITPLEGIREYVRKNCPGTVTVTYEQGYRWDRPDLGDSLRSAAVAKAKDCDVVLYFGGLQKWDGKDGESIDRQEYGLPYGQDKLISDLADANPNLNVILVAASAVEMPWADKAQSITYAWYSGSEAGNAIAEVIFGDVNPSGKLPFTIYRDLADCGAHATGAYSRDSDTAEYREGMYVGYRWTDLKGTAPLYPFGYGLSYTAFEYSGVKLSRQEISLSDLDDGEEITVSLTVRNTGERDGKETVQIYVRDVKSSLERPYKELKGFEKVSVPAGGQAEVNISLGKDAFACYDDADDCWKVEPGRFEILAGHSSDGITGKARLEIIQ